MAKVSIAGRDVGDHCPVFMVAELGINHNGSVAIAKHLVDVSAKLGAHAVKFQKRTVPVVFNQAELEKPRDVPRWLLEHAIGREVLPEESVKRLKESDFSDTRNGDQKWALELTCREFAEINAYCKEKGILWSASPWDEESVDFLAEFGVPFYKVASASLTDAALLARIRSKSKPVVLSTGGSSMEQIRHAVKVLGTKDLILLHCTAAYPKGESPEVLSQINLRVMDALRKEFPDVPVGFSSNDGGRVPAFAAAARGACMLEVHLTLDRAMWGSDQASSMEPVWFRELCEWTNNLTHMLGDGIKTVYPTEREVMAKLRRVV